MINLGDKKIKKIYLGLKEVSKIYYGTKKVYPNYSLSLSTSELLFVASGESKELTINVEDSQEWSLTIPAGFSASKTSGIGTSTVTITTSNNTSTNAKTGVITITSYDLSATCNISQSAGSKIYSTPIVNLSYSDIPAKGGTVNPTISYSQPWTWNGVTGSGGTITTGGTISYSGTSVNTTSGAVTGSSKGTTPSDKTLFTTATVSVSLNNKTGKTSATVYQQANVKTLSGISADSLSYDGISVLGGTSSPYYSITAQYSFTSGANSTEDLDNRSRSKLRVVLPVKTFSIKTPVTGISIDSSTGVITAGEVEQTSGKTVTVVLKADYNGFTSSIEGTCSQPAGSMVYANPVITLSYPSASAAGGTVTPTFKVTQKWGWNNDTNEGTLTYDINSMPSNGSVKFTANTGTVNTKGQVTVPTKGTTESGVTTYSTITCNVTVNGKSASTNANISQAANTKTLNSIRIEKRQPDDTWVSIDSWDNVAANGGVLGVIGYNVYKYSSGSSSESKLDPASISPTVNIDVDWAEEYNPGFINGCVNIPTRGTTIGNKRDGNVSWTINKLTSNSLSFSQSGNYVTAIKGSIGTFSYPTISAGAISATPNLSAGFGVLFTFSSGSTSSSTPAATYGSLSVPHSFKLSASQNGFTAVNASTGVLTATNRGTTIGAARTSGTVTRTLTATWTPTSSYNSAGTKTDSWSTTATCTQALNKVVSIKFESTSGSSSTTEYPAGDIPASGGTKIPNKTSQTRSTYSSGSTEINTDGRVANRTWSMPSSSGFSLNAQTGAITASSRGTTVGNRRSCNPSCVLSVTFTNPASVGGNTVSDTLTESFTVYQEANNVERVAITTGGGVDDPYPTKFSAAGDAYVAAAWAYYTSNAKQEIQNVTFDNWSIDGSGFTMEEDPNYPYAVDIWAENRGTTVGPERSVTISFEYSGKADSITLTQEANEQKQTACSIEIDHDFQDPLGYNNTNVPAAGGRVCIIGIRHYSYTSGATNQNEYDSFTLNSNQSWCASDDASNLTISSRGTVTGSDRSATVYWQDGTFKSNEMTITQKANQITITTIIKDNGNSPDLSFEASGGWAGYVARAIYSSGATSYGRDLSGWSFDQSWGSLEINNSGQASQFIGLTVQTRGTEAGSARTGTLKTTYGLGASITITQKANSLTWNTPTISRTTPVSMPVGGGSNNVATGLTYSQTGKYSSGSPASASSGGSLTYSVVTAKTGFSLSGSTVTVTNNTSTSARNGFVVRITLKLNGKTATKDITYNQAAGYYTYATPVVSASYPTIPASGGTVTPTVSYSQTYGWNGATSGVGTITSGGTISYSGTSVNTSNGSVTAGSKGTTVSGVTTVTTAIISVASHGKTGTKSVAVQQKANTQYDKRTVLHFDNFAGPASKTVSAAGGEVYC